jgi:hypothetical protein
MSDKKITQLTTATTPVAGTEVLPFVQSGATKQVSVANLTVGRAVNALSYAATSVDSIQLPATTANIDIGTAWGAHTINFRAGGTTFFSFGTTSNVYCATGGFVSGYSAPASFGSSNLYDVNLIRNNTTSASVVYNGIAFPSGNGIDFSADGQAAGMTSELLDDYEEGTWTPVITADAGTITSYTASGVYTKIGNTVRATFTTTITDNGTGASILNATLPFATANIGEMSVGSGRNNATGNMIQAWAFQGSSTAKLYLYNNSYPVATGSVVYCTVVYQAA